jgi:hypothetical protein
MINEDSAPEEIKKPLYKKIREQIFPIKQTDNSLVKFGKNTGFILFLIMFSLVSLMIVMAIAFAL